MKYIFLIAIVAIVYVVLFRHAPVAEVKQAVKQEDSGINLKRPIDRTHEVLDQVKKRNGDGEF